MKKSCRKCAPIASPRPLFNLVNNLKLSLHARTYFLKRDVLKKDYQKALKKLTLFFLSNRAPCNEQERL